MPIRSETWNEVLRLARMEGVAPLVSESLRLLADAATPRDVRLTFVGAYGEAAMNSERAYAELASILRALGSADVSPVLFKGAALARFVYADPALRPFGDIDLLIRKEEVHPVHNKLVQMGYMLAGGEPSTADLVYRHGRGYYDPGRRRITIDVHWRYSGYPHLLEFDYEGVFTRAQEVLIDDVAARVPSPEDSIVASSVFFLREIWYAKPKLRYLRDIVEVTRRCTVDWNRVVHLALKTAFLRTPLYLMLDAAVELLGARVPREVRDALKPPRFSGVTWYLRRKICRGVLHRHGAWSAVWQVTLIRWLDDPSFEAIRRWGRTLAFVPPALAASQQRWMRRLWQPRSF